MNSLALVGDPCLHHRKQRHRDSDHPMIRRRFAAPNHSATRESGTFQSYSVSAVAACWAWTISSHVWFGHYVPNFSTWVRVAWLPWPALSPFLHGGLQQLLFFGMPRSSFSFPSYVLPHDGFHQRVIHVHRALQKIPELFATSFERRPKLYTSRRSPYLNASTMC